jgi:hypothetical protein
MPDPKAGFPPIPRDFTPILPPWAPAWMIRPCGHVEEDFYPDQRHGWRCRDCVLWHSRRLVASPLWARKN